jgi:hypothetical protein
VADVVTRDVVNKSLLLGGNEYETGIVTIPASSTLARGALLLRKNGKFAPVADITKDIPVAVNPVELKNTAAASADVPFRALVAGRVRFDMLYIGTEPITDAQSDMLRAYGILPRKVTDVSWTRE